jgi:soluble lytic murein transglycosylase-like protein
MAGCAVLLALAPTVQAAERIALRNGFEVLCDHHVEAGSRVRLFLTAGEDNYIEFPPQEIVDVERVPDPPAAPRSAASPVTSPAATLNAQLSPTDHNLDVDLLASLIKAESGGNAHAVSPAGARGLMQLMPGTAAGLGVKDSFKPDENVRGGSTYLDALLTRYHDNLALALAAYNAGPAAVDKYRGIPPYRETITYVARVIHEFNRRVLAREAEAKRAATQARAARD